MDIDALQRDEYGRPHVPALEVPPPGTGLIMRWRGRVTTPEAPSPANTVTPGEYDHRQCVDGWYPSDAWWLHCGRCR